MSTWLKSFIAGAAVILVLYIVNAMMSSTGFFGAGIDDYQARLLVFIGINVILATSLNLINGFTGQFSIGHAGFMAVAPIPQHILALHTVGASRPLCLGWEKQLRPALFC